MILRHDFQNIPEDAEIILHPSEANPIHREPAKDQRIGIYLQCEGSNLYRGRSSSAMPQPDDVRLCLYAREPGASAITLGPMAPRWLRPSTCMTVPLLF